MAAADGHARTPDRRPYVYDAPQFCAFAGSTPPPPPSESSWFERRGDSSPLDQSIDLVAIAPAHGGGAGDVKGMAPLRNGGDAGGLGARECAYVTLEDLDALQKDAPFGAQSASPAKFGAAPDCAALAIGERFTVEEQAADTHTNTMTATGATGMATDTHSAILTPRRSPGSHENGQGSRCATGEHVMDSDARVEEEQCSNDTVAPESLQVMNSDGCVLSSAIRESEQHAALAAAEDAVGASVETEMKLEDAAPAEQPDRSTGQVSKVSVNETEGKLQFTEDKSAIKSPEGSDVVVHAAVEEAQAETADAVMDVESSEATQSVAQISDANSTGVSCDQDAHDDAGCGGQTAAATPPSRGFTVHIGCASASPKTTPHTPGRRSMLGLSVVTHMDVDACAGAPATPGRRSSVSGTQSVSATPVVRPGGDDAYLASPARSALKAESPVSAGSSPPSAVSSPDREHGAVQRKRRVVGATPQAMRVAGAANLPSMNREDEGTPDDARMDDAAADAAPDANPFCDAPRGTIGDGTAVRGRAPSEAALGSPHTLPKAIGRLAAQGYRDADAECASSPALGEGAGRESPSGRSSPGGLPPAMATTPPRGAAGAAVESAAATMHDLRIGAPAARTPPRNVFLPPRPAASPRVLFGAPPAHRVVPNEPRLGQVRAPDRARLERLRTAGALLPARSTKPLTVPCAFSFATDSRSREERPAPPTRPAATAPAQPRQAAPAKRAPTVPVSPVLHTRARADARPPGGPAPRTEKHGVPLRTGPAPAPAAPVRKTPAGTSTRNAHPLLSRAPAVRSARAPTVPVSPALSCARRVRSSLPAPRP